MDTLSWLLFVVTLAVSDGTPALTLEVAARFETAAACRVAARHLNGNVATRRAFCEQRGTV